MKKSFNLELNFVTEKNSRDTIFVFWNNFFINRKKFKNDINYSKQMMLFTWAATNNTMNQNIDFINTFDLEETLQIAKNSGFKKAIIQTPGHLIESGFLKTFDEITKDMSWMLYGHILDKKDKYLELHDQLIVINLEKFDLDELDPGLDNKIRLMPMYDRSEKNFHDKYTPYWVKFNEEYSHCRCRFGWKWISKALLNDELFIFDARHRRYKKHLYPENVGHYEDWYAIGNNDTNLAAILDSENNISSRGIHVFNNENCNTDRIKKITEKTQFDTIIVPASGFYAMEFFSEIPIKKVVYYDKLKQTLELREKINSDWNGTQDQLKKIIENYDNIFSDLKEKEINIFNDNSKFKSREHIKEVTDRFSKIDKEYYQLDLITEFDKLIENIPKEGSVYIWLNGIYTYWPNIFEHKPHNMYNSYVRFIEELKKFPNEIWVNCKEPSGAYKIFNVKSFTFDFINVSGYDYWC